MAYGHWASYRESRGESSWGKDNKYDTKLEYMYLDGLLSPSPCLDCILVCLWARNVRRTCSTV